LPELPVKSAHKITPATAIKNIPLLTVVFCSLNIKNQILKQLYFTFAALGKNNQYAPSPLFKL